MRPFGFTQKKNQGVYFFPIWCYSKREKEWERNIKSATNNRISIVQQTYEICKSHTWNKQSPDKQLRTDHIIGIAMELGNYPLVFSLGAASQALEPPSPIVIIGFIYLFCCCSFLSWSPKNCMIYMTRVNWISSVNGDLLLDAFLQNVLFLDRPLGGQTIAVVKRGQRIEDKRRSRRGGGRLAPHDCWVAATTAHQICISS